MDYGRQRQQMVEWDLARRGIVDPRVLDAFRRVSREAFVRPDLLELAYEDEPLPIGEGQTISQPYVVALTAQALQLEGDERVLDIGTGSGYAAAILSLLAAEVTTIERFASLADAARERLARLGFANIRVVCGDGSLGWPEHAPYDAIAVAAGAPDVPDALREQLAVGGRLVIPVGRDIASQELIRVTREGPTKFRDESLGGVRFVPLIGAQGWSDSESRSCATRSRC
jgi:protein-L-isoaspartate(D-aspartate) O-methyltransferase